MAVRREFYPDVVIINSNFVIFFSVFPPQEKFMNEIFFSVDEKHPYSITRKLIVFLTSNKKHYCYFIRAQ